MVKRSVVVDMVEAFLKPSCQQWILFGFIYRLILVKSHVLNILYGGPVVVTLKQICQEV